VIGDLAFLEQMTADVVEAAAVLPAARRLMEGTA